MKTGCFKTFKGSNGIAVCLYPPDSWKGPIYTALQPDYNDFCAIKHGNISEDEFKKRYTNKILNKLDVQKVYDELKDKVLLCWEPAGENCHRRIIANWFQSKLGIEVPEWEKPNRNKKENKSSELF